MEVKLKTKPLKTIYSSLGLEEKGRVQQSLGKTTADSLKKYVSFKSGVQEGATNSIEGGTKVIINVPYAGFQAGGKVMVGVRSRKAWAKRGERKVVINKDLKYHSDKLRGKQPFERMKADKGQSILNQTAKYARRISK